MRLPFRRHKPLIVRLLHTIAAAAGTARLALRRRTLHPRAMGAPRRRMRTALKRG
jgi:hypothetical protein